MKLGAVGATGLVGQSFLKLLASPSFAGFAKQIRELRLFSRKRRELVFQGKTLETAPLAKGVFEGLDIVFFSAGSAVSREWAGRAVLEGATAIDNSSAFRRDRAVPLIVPEVNGRLIQKQGPQLLSNPNCSTIQLTAALSPLHKAFGLQSVRVVSFQASSGAGKAALAGLKEESLNILKGELSYETERPSPAFNCLPYIGDISEESGVSEEESKIMLETKKILEIPDLKISAFTVRVPAFNSHGEAVFVTLKNPPASKEEIRAVFKDRPGLRLERPDRLHGRHASGKEDVFVGRIHKSAAAEGEWIMWIAADNLLKGAALNGLQIAETVMRQKTGILREKDGKL